MFTDDTIPSTATVMEGSVRALVDMEWDGLKLDSCSQFQNMTWWAELINKTGRPIEQENCHQGGFAPGMKQWQSCKDRGGLLLLLLLSAPNRPKTSRTLDRIKTNTPSG